MLIKIRAVGRDFLFDEDYVCSISSFKKVLESYGAKAIAYVSFMADCDNELYAFLDSDIRMIKAMQATLVSKECAESKEVKAAIKEYAEIQVRNPYTKLKKSVDTAISNISGFLDTKTKGGTIKDDDIDTVTKLIIDAPKMLKSREDIGKFGEAEQSKVGRRKGGGDLTLAEERLRKRQ